MNSYLWMIMILIVLLGVGLLIIFFCCGHDQLVYMTDVLTSYTDFITQINDLIPPSNYIDIPMYYINLDRSVDRRVWMEGQIKRFNIHQAQRISGVNGRNDPTIVYRNNFDCMSNGEVGCTLSHLRAIKMAYDAGLEHVLIVEDDATFSLMPHWNMSLSECIAQAPKDWDIIKLFSNYSSTDEVDTITFIKVPFATFYTVGYIINRSGLAKILARADDNGCFVLSSEYYYRGSADEYIYNVDPTLVVYQTHPLLIYPDNRSLASMIHDDHTLTHINHAAQAVIPYIDRIFTKYLPNVPDKFADHLLRPRRKRSSAQAPTQVDIVCTTTDTGDIQWLEQALQSISPAYYRLFIYHRGSKPRSISLVHDLVIIHERCTDYQAKIGHGLWVRDHSIYTLFVHEDHPLSTEDILHSQTFWTPLPCVLPHYDGHDESHYNPLCLRSLNAWYGAIWSSSLPTEISNTQPITQGTCMFSSSIYHQVSREIWLRILFTLTYNQGRVAESYLASVWGVLASQK